MEIKPWWEDREMPDEFNVVGKRHIVERADARAKATGSAIYSADIQHPNMLWAKMMNCPYAHARIKNMDTSKAESVPGVVAVLRYDDPEIQAIPAQAAGPESFLHGSDEFHWEGEPGGVAVAAESEEICDEALKMVEIEWEELPFILDIEEAAASGAPVLHPEHNDENNELLSWTIEEGDLEEGLAEADFTFEDTFKIQPLPHCGAETYNALAEWKGDSLTMWSKRTEDKY